MVGTHPVITHFPCVLNQLVYAVKHYSQKVFECHIFVWKEMRGPTLTPCLAQILGIVRHRNAHTVIFVYLLYRSVKK